MEFDVVIVGAGFDDVQLLPSLIGVEDESQLVNLANRTSAADLRYFREAVRRQFECAGPSCRF